MAITRSQIARQLMQEGGVPRQGYFLGKLVRKIKDDIIPNELKSPAGAAAAAALASYGLGRMQPGADNRGIFGNILEGGKRVLFGKPTQEGERGITREGGLFGGIKKAGSAAAEAIMKPRFPNPNQKNTEPQSIGDRLLSGIFGGPGLALASGLLAGAFTKDKEDPIYTGQDVGLNLQDIAKLANLSDPKTASAIGLRFSPDVEARKFTPAEMAETYAANQPVDFTEKREQAQDGGMMGDQKDFEEFLQDMQNRDNQMLQDRIMRDFEEFMKRKRMIDQMPEAKDGGIMKMKDGGLTKYEISSLKGLGYDTKGGTVLEPFGGLKVLRDILKVNKMAEGGIASMADGGMMDMGGMEMDLRGGGFVPMGRAEKADDVPARLSKNEFVFTADAVRAAGGGDVDKGADKMYATMKKLEDRVA